MTNSTVGTSSRLGHRRVGTAIFAALIAFSAYAGAVGLITGGLTLTADLNERLPLGSPLVGGVALALIVALPTTWVSWLAWHDDARADAAALVAGILLVGWILVELAFIRKFSFFHPTYLVVGAVLIWIGRHGRHDLPALLPRRR
jgi:hypothetical protein